MTSSRRRLAAVPDRSDQRAVAYVRVSAVMGREELHSPDLQLRRIRDLIDRRGLREVDVISDIDVSGRHFQREGIQRVLALARAGHVDVVALYDLSRLGRNTGESLRVITELRNLGVSVASSVEQIDDTPEGQFMLGQFLGMAQLYSDQMGRRWAETARYRAERGLYVGGHAPLGYVLTPGEGISPDPELAPRVQEVFTRYARGDRLSDIARDFNRGHSRARHVAHSVVKRMLGNPVYLGKVKLNGQIYDGVHQALIDPATWQRVVERLDRDARTPPRRLAVAYALSGLVWCAGCGGRLQHMNTGPSHKAVAQLICPTHKEHRACPTGGVGRPASGEVERVVLDQVRVLLSERMLGAAEQAEHTSRVARAGQDLRRVRRELTDTRAARGRLAVDFARRVVPEDAYRMADAELAGAEAALVEALGDAEISARRRSPARARQAFRALEQRWETMSGAERNQGLRYFVSRVEVRRPARRGGSYEDRVTTIPR